MSVKHNGRPFRALFALICVSSLAGCQSVATPVQAVNQRNAAVPLTMIADSLPVARFDLPGDRQGYFLVDTAASDWTIQPEAAAGFDLEIARRESAIGLNGSIAVDIVRLPVRLAEAELSAIVDAAVVRGPQFDDPPVMGLAGVSLFAGRTVRFDFSCRVLEVDAAAPLRPRELLNAQWLAPWKILVPVRIGDVAGMAMVDTGAEHSVINARFAHLLNLSPNAARGGMSGIDGRVQVLTSFTAPSVDIGPWHWRDIDIATGELGVFQRMLGADQPQMVLGMDLLQTKAFTIDYPNQQIWAEQGRC